MQRVRDAVPPVEGVTCGDIYNTIEEAIAHCVAAIHGALLVGTEAVCASAESRGAEQGPFDGLVGAAAVLFGPQRSG